MLFYRKMFGFIILLLIASTTMMIYLYPDNQVWASFFSSISAGCITGLILLIYQNLKDKDAKKLDRQLENHPQMSSRLMQINTQFRVHQRALLDAEGEEFQRHLAGTVKFANQYVREFFRLTSVYPKYYRDFVYESIGYKWDFRDVLGKVDWLESKMDEPPPAPASRENNERMEYITVAHDIHCAFFEVFVKMENTEKDIAKKRNNIDASIV